MQNVAVQRRQVRCDFASFEPAYPCLREVSKDYYKEGDEENLTFADQDPKRSIAPIEIYSKICKTIHLDSRT